MTRRAQKSRPPRRMTIALLTEGILTVILALQALSAIIIIKPTHAFILTTTLHSSTSPISKTSKSFSTLLRMTSDETSSTTIFSLNDSTTILQKWDRVYNKEEGSADKIDELESELQISKMQLAKAVLLLNHQATSERDADSATGRCMLGICAGSVEEGISTLKSWVTALDLPRGLLHGMDKDGVPLEIQGGVYIKYNSGGVYTFADIRKSGMGFDALWKPGDAMCEEYDGNYRGVYFQVELQDKEFRQFLVPLALFEE